MSAERKIERRTLDKLIEQIGPYGLIAACVMLIISITTRPWDINTWVSVSILCVIIGVSFLIDWLRLKSFTALEQIKIEADLKFKEHEAWVEGIQKPTLMRGTSQGMERMVRTRSFLSIVQLLENDLKEGELTKEQNDYCQALIKRIRDLERVTAMV